MLRLVFAGLAALALASAAYADTPPAIKATATPGACGKEACSCGKTCTCSHCTCGTSCRCGGCAGKVAQAISQAVGCCQSARRTAVVVVQRCERPVRRFFARRGFN